MTASNIKSAKKTPAKRKAPTRRASPSRTTATPGMGRLPTKPKILITGAAGALAKYVIDNLRVDYRIVGVDFRGLKAMHPDTVDYEVDFNKRSFEDVFREHEFSAVLHLGRIKISDLDRGRRFSSNVIGTERLLRFALKYGVEQVLVLSTYHVYGADANNPSLIDEDFPLKAAAYGQELVDAVELENLANIYLYKHPELNITILRPCNIAGAGINNSMSRMLAQPLAPCVGGFSPLMQFIHVQDMADAVVAALTQNKRGVYNVAPDDWVAYQDALHLAGCRRLFLPSIPPRLTRHLAGLMGRYAPPAYMLDFFKFAVVIDAAKFSKTFDFKPAISYDELFTYYRTAK